MRASPPPPPRIALRVTRDEAAPDPRGGFLRLHRSTFVIESGEAGQPARASEPVTYDFVTRRQMDASIIVAHCRQDGVRHVYLRSAIRPPLVLRADAALPDCLWELPAGLVDPGESPAAAAARELGEELGFDARDIDMTPLGPRSVPLPGAVAELQYYFAVEVDPAARRAPAEDGALETGAAILLVPLDEALAWCRAGHLVDTKTELGLRRLAELS